MKTKVSTNPHIKQVKKQQRRKISTITKKHRIAAIATAVSSSDSSTPLQTCSTASIIKSTHFTASPSHAKTLQQSLIISPSAAFSVETPSKLAIDSIFSPSTSSFNTTKYPKHIRHTYAQSAQALTTTTSRVPQTTTFRQTRALFSNTPFTIAPCSSTFEPSNVLSLDDPSDPAVLSQIISAARTMSHLAHTTPRRTKPQHQSILHSAKRHMSTTTPSLESTENPHEEITQGANLVQIQQAVNQWAQLNFKGMEFLRSGSPQDLINAESCFQQCATSMEQYPLLPYRTLSLSNLASCLMRKGNYTEAIKIFQPLTQQLLLFKQISLSQIATVHMELASAYELSGHHDSAVKELYIASSRFVHAAAHYLSQIQASDHTHFSAVHKKEPLGDSPDSQNDILREDQRQVIFSNAMECWRTALGCRYSAIVLQHRMQNLDFAVTELKKLSTVYKYVLATIMEVQKYRWDRGEGGVDDTNDNIDVPVDPQLAEIDKKLIPHPEGVKILENYPPCPPEAKVVTFDICRIFPDLSLGHLEELYNKITIEVVSILHSLANVYIDQGNFVEACATLKESCDIMNPLDEAAYLQVASESSKTLRLVYEKILFEHQQITDPNAPVIVQVTDQSKIKFANQKEVEATIKLINKTRAEIFALFTNYLQAHLINTKQTIEDELQHNTTFLEDLPPDAKQFFDFTKDRVKQDLESGSFYEHAREVYKKELGEQFDDDNQDLLLVKPAGYKRNPFQSPTPVDNDQKKQQ